MGERKKKSVNLRDDRSARGATARRTPVWMSKMSPCFHIPNAHPFTGRIKTSDRSKSVPLGPSHMPRHISCTVADLPGRSKARTVPANYTVNSIHQHSERRLDGKNLNRYDPDYAPAPPLFALCSLLLPRPCGTTRWLDYRPMSRPQAPT